MKKFSFILAVFALIGFSAPVFAVDLGTTVTNNKKRQYNQVGKESVELSSGDVSGEKPEVDQGSAIEEAPKKTK